MTLKSAFFASLVLIAAACSSDVAYDRFTDTPIDGWVRNDTLSFDTSPIQSPGMYDMSIGVRINGEYPFKSITLLVNTTSFPSGRTDRDTVLCPVVGDNGEPLGHGMSYFTTTQVMRQLDIKRGDSLHITVCHYMRRNELPGIAGVGIKLRLKD